MQPRALAASPGNRFRANPILTRMRPAIRLAPYLTAFAAYVAAGHRSATPTPGITLPPLSRIVRVTLTDAASGDRLGAVQRADSVAALTALYARLAADGATEARRARSWWPRSTRIPCRRRSSRWHPAHSRRGSAAASCTVRRVEKKRSPSRG